MPHSDQRSHLLDPRVDTAKPHETTWTPDIDWPATSSASAVQNLGNVSQMVASLKPSLNGAGSEHTFPIPSPPEVQSCSGQ